MDHLTFYLEEAQKKKSKIMVLTACAIGITAACVMARTLFPPFSITRKKVKATPLHRSHPQIAFGLPSHEFLVGPQT